MNILFLSLLGMKSFDDENIYMDLLNEFIDNGHKVFIVSPTERRNKEKTNIIEKNGSKILRVKTGNIQKTNIIEKGITTVLIESIFKRAIKKYYKGIKFDLVLYATPPITLCNVIKYIKKRDNAKTYLMLKDIFPQNAVDLGMFSKKSIFYKYFRNKEINLYKMSDRIGCMSPKNVEYLLEHNSYIDKKKVEVCPNSIKIREKNKFNPELRKKYREKYNIPEEAKVFVYGGNLGKPQGVDFIVECLKKCSDIDNCYFVICGTGTDYYKLDNYVKNDKPKHVILINGLPKNEYNEFLNIGDVGLIFLDYRFTIPNFPSRILSYMEKSMPILACTDPNTDVGDIIEKNGFGWKCYSRQDYFFKKMVNNIVQMPIKKINRIGEYGNKYLKEKYNNNIDTIKQIIDINENIILVVDIAASTGGALSVLTDYYEQAKIDKNNNYVFLLSNNYIRETDNIKIIVLKKYKKWINRMLFDYFYGKKIVKKLRAKTVLSLQNTCIRGISVKQILYVHQAIPFQKEKNFSFFKKRETKLAIIQYLIGHEIKKSIRKCDEIIVQTNWMKKAIANQCKIDEKKILIKKPNVLYKTNNNSNNVNYNQFFYPTSNAIYKNNEVIIKAVELLKKEGINSFNVKLTIDGISSNNIEYIGRISQKEVFNYYTNSVLLFSSYIETFGLPMLEAKMNNSYIIASDTVFSHEILDGYDKVEFFNPFDPIDLKEKMKKIMSKGEK